MAILHAQRPSNRRDLEADERTSPEFRELDLGGLRKPISPLGNRTSGLFEPCRLHGPPGDLIIIKFELNGSYFYSGRFQSSTTPSRQLTGRRNGKKRARNELKRVNDDDPDSLTLMILGTPLDSFFLSMVCLGGLICQVYHIHVDSDA